ncbi:MAG: alpha/beta hydrolase [Candidatus Heimdallarchaeaceae archaeon]
MAKQEAHFMLIHGFTGTHYEMNPLEKFLKDKGYYVENLILPGHETSIEELEKYQWKDWVEYAQDRLEGLKSKEGKVFVCGLSLGGAITLYLGAKNQDLSGIVLMATPYKAPRWELHLFTIFPFIPWFYRYHKSEEVGWEDLEALSKHRCYGIYPTKAIIQLGKFLKKIKKIIPKIEIPTLILQSIKDPGIPSSHPKWIFDHISSRDKKLVWIKKGGHVIPEDSGKNEAFEAIELWLNERI